MDSQEKSPLDVNDNAIYQNRDKPSLEKGFIAGLIAAILSAFLCSLLIHNTGYKIGYIAIGFIISYAVKTFGKGTDIKFAYMGAGLALFGCFLCNALVIAFLIQTQYYFTSLQTVFTLINPNFIFMTISHGFIIENLPPFGMAVYLGYRFSKADSYD